MEHGSFRRASEALLVRQSMLGRCILQLERSMGVVVFEQSIGGVRVTATGHVLLRAARSILEQVDALVAIAQSGPWRLRSTGCQILFVFVRWELPGDAYGFRATVPFGRSGNGTVNLSNVLT